MPTDDRTERVTAEQVKDVVRRYAEQTDLPLNNAAVVIEYKGYPTETLLVAPVASPSLSKS
jgi:hypothetical protein